MSGPTLYVYAIVPTAGVPENPGRGVDGSPVIAVDGGHGASALAHRHDETPYEGPDDEVRRWIVEHSDVVDRSWQAAGTALPVSFNVIVSPSETQTADEVLRSWLSDSAEILGAKLEALQGRVELRIEITVDSAEVSDDADEVRRLIADMDAKPAGVQRLYQKKLDKLRRDVADRMADDLYPEIRQRILAFSEDLSENRQSRAVPGTVPVLNVSVLVRSEDVAGLGVELADIRDSHPGVAISFIGPWPPYSFADLPSMAPSESAEA